MGIFLFIVAVVLIVTLQIGLPAYQRDVSLRQNIKSVCLALHGKRVISLVARAVAGLVLLVVSLALIIGMYSPASQDDQTRVAQAHQACVAETARSDKAIVARNKLYGSIMRHGTVSQKKAVKAMKLTSFEDNACDEPEPSKWTIDNEYKDNLRGIHASKTALPVIRGEIAQLRNIGSGLKTNVKDES